MLAAAREDYAREARAGRPVWRRSRATPSGWTRWCAMVVDAACDRMATPVAVCAVGGYGRRALCLHSDIDLLIVFGGTIGREEERFVKAVLQPLWDLRLALGQHVRELGRLRRARSRQPRVPARRSSTRATSPATAISTSELAARLAERRRTRVALDPLARADRAASRTSSTTRSISSSLTSSTRRAGSATSPRFATLRVLAPERSTAADATAGDRVAGRRGLPAPRPLGAASASRPRRQHAHPRAPGEGRRHAGRCRGAAAAARRSADGRILPARAGRRLGRWRRRAARRPAAAPAMPRAISVGRHFEVTADGVRFADPEPRRASAVAVARGVPDRARTTAARCRSRRSACIEQNLRSLHRRRLRRDRRGSACSCAQLLAPAPGPLRAALGNARLRAAQSHLSRSSRRFTAAWSATSITSTPSTSTRC